MEAMSKEPNSCVVSATRCGMQSMLSRTNLSASSKKPFEMAVKAGQRLEIDIARLSGAGAGSLVNGQGGSAGGCRFHFFFAGIPRCSASKLRFNSTISFGVSVRLWWGLTA